MSGRSKHLGVVVGVDGSPSSRLAVRWATREAMMRNILLTLVNVVQTPAASSSSLAWPAAPIPADVASWQEERGGK